MNIEESLGLNRKLTDVKEQRERLQLYINLKLASTGQPVSHAGDDGFISIANDLLKSYREKNL